MNMRVKEQEALANRLPAKRAPLKGTSITSIPATEHSVVAATSASSSVSTTDPSNKIISSASHDVVPVDDSANRGSKPHAFEIEEFVDERAVGDLERTDAAKTAPSIGQERAEWNVDLHSIAMQSHCTKVTSGITSKVLGGSQILNEKHIQQLESVSFQFIR